MTLAELLGLIREKLALVIIVPLVVAGLTAGYCWGFMTNDYQASTSMLVLTKSSTTQGTISSSDMSASQQAANDISELAKTTKVKDAAAKQLGMSSLDGYKVSVNSSTQNRVLKIVVTGKNPDSVAAVANAVANQVSKVAMQAMNLEAVNIVEEAVAPTDPSGPPRLQYTGIAFLAALFAMIALIVLMDMLDGTVKSADELEELTDLPVLCKAPKVKGMK